MHKQRRVKIASYALHKKIKYGGSEIHLVGRKKEPLILEAKQRGEMSVALGGGVNVAPGSRGATRERECVCLRRLILVPVSGRVCVSLAFICAHPLKWID